MALITNAIKGTQDTLPKESYKIQYVESAVRETAEIELPENLPINKEGIKSIWSIIKTVLLWIVTILFLLYGFGSFPSFSSISAFSCSL